VCEWDQFVAEVSGVSARRSARKPTGGCHDLHVGRADLCASGRGAGDKVNIFMLVDRRETARLDVGVSSDTKVGSVHVPVRFTVQVGRRPGGSSLLVKFALIRANRPHDHICALVSQADLVDEPTRRHLRVGVRAGEEGLMPPVTIEFIQHRIGARSSCSSNAREV
jgi:hypothetical protein